MQSRITVILLILCIGRNIVCDDYDRGAADAKTMLRDNKAYIKTALISGLSSYLFPGCGCTAVSLYKYFNNAALPFELYGETEQYRDGFRKVYVPQMKTKNLKYSIIGGSMGSVLSIASIAVIIIIVKNL